MWLVGSRVNSGRRAWASCAAMCGIFSRLFNPGGIHPLYHQGSPASSFKSKSPTLPLRCWLTIEIPRSVSNPGGWECIFQQAPWGSDVAQRFENRWSLERVVDWDTGKKRRSQDEESEQEVEAALNPGGHSCGTFCHPSAVKLLLISK